MAASYFADRGEAPTHVRMPDSGQIRPERFPFRYGSRSRVPARRSGTSGMLQPDSAGIRPEQESCPGFRHPKNQNESRNVQPSKTTATTEATTSCGKTQSWVSPPTIMKWAWTRVRQTGLMRIIILIIFISWKKLEVRWCASQVPRKYYTCEHWIRIGKKIVSDAIPVARWQMFSPMTLVMTSAWMICSSRSSKAMDRPKSPDWMPTMARLTRSSIDGLRQWKLVLF